LPGKTAAFATKPLRLNFPRRITLKKGESSSASRACLAADLEVPPHRLSYLINRKFQGNFSHFINTYRISEAKRLPREHPERNILRIAYEVGFNSQAPFNRAFLKITGKRPREFRLEYTENSSNAV